MFPSDDDARARDVFLRALDLPRSQRGDWVEHVLHDRPDLAERVCTLLADAGDVSTAHGSDETPLWFEPLLEVDRLGDYRILGILGRGGMSVVLHGEQVSTGWEVALKLLPPGVVSPALRERLLREGEILARLRHPSICRVRDWGVFDTTDGPRPYLALDLRTGKPLLDWVRDDEPSVERRLHVLEQIARAVDHAHDHGVVHRDLKPSNVLVERGDLPCVLDFGVAKVLEESGLADRTLTRAGQLVGTVGYMSPEQALGRLEEIGPATDVHALGLLTFEVLTLQKPYPVPAHLGEALPAIAAARPRRLSDLDSRWKGDADAVCDRALRRNPRDRYHTADALADDLRALRQGQRIHGRRGWRALRRQPSRVLSVGVPIAVAVGILITLLWARTPAPDPRALQDVLLSLQRGSESLHRRPPTAEGIAQSITFLETAEEQLSRIPPGLQEQELRRFLLWRLGEAHYFLGSSQHDPRPIEEALSVWERAARIRRTSESRAAIDSRWVVSLEVRDIGSFRGHQGMGLAHAHLARFGEPAAHWRRSVQRRNEALLWFTRERTDDVETDWQELPVERGGFDLGLLLNEAGESHVMLGRVMADTALVESGLARLRVVKERNLLRRDHIALASLWFNLGRAYSTRGELTASSEDVELAAAWLDSALTGRTESRNPCAHAEARRWQVLVDGQRARLETEPLERARWRRNAARLAESVAERLGTRLHAADRALLALEWATVEVDAALEGDALAIGRADSLLTEAEPELSRNARPPAHSLWLLQRARLAKARSTLEPAAEREADRLLDEAQSVLPRPQFAWLHEQCEAERARWQTNGTLAPTERAATGSSGKRP